MFKPLFRFQKVIRKIPIWLRIGLVAVVAALVYFSGEPTGPVFAMAGLAAAPSSRTLGGGNKLYFRELTKQADGTFIVKTTTDVIGAAAGTWHVLGSHTDTPWARLDNAQYTLEPTLVENDLARKTLLEKVAPYTTTIVKLPPELDLEDGTVLETGTSIDGDKTKPYFDFIYFQAPTPAGKEHVFYCVGQFDRATSLPFKTNTWNLWKVKLLSVDAHGYTLADPPSTSRLTGVTFAALSGILAQGTVVEQA